MKNHLSELTRGELVLWANGKLDKITQDQHRSTVLAKTIYNEY